MIDTGGTRSAVSGLGTALLIYSPDGALKYYEEFGRRVLGMVSVRDGKRDRLAVMLTDRLLLEP